MDKYLLERVENFKEFLTVKELDSRLRKIAGRKNVLEIGKSAAGRQILCAKIGKGKKNALVFGFPHPNEPIGSLTCLSLAKIVLENSWLQKKFTWHIVPCADPDGAELNKGWFKGNFSIKKYAYNYYRSRTRLQTEWSFPAKYKDYKFNKPPQNVKALKKLIEKTKPSLVYPVHNAGFSGAYFFITKNMPKKYYREVIKLCNSLKIPLDLGEPEAQFIKELKKPFYRDFGLEDYYEHYKKRGKNFKDVWSGGTSSISFSKKINKKLFGLIGEIPYIYDPKVSSTAKTMKARKENLSKALELETEVVGFMEKAIACKSVNKKSIFYDLLKYTAKGKRKRIEAEKANLEKKEFKRKATKAEEFTALIVGRFVAALNLGEVRRLLLESRKSRETKKLIKEVENKISEFISYIDKNSKYSVLPIKRLVQLQLGFLLISLDYL